MNLYEKFYNWIYLKNKYFARKIDWNIQCLRRLIGLDKHIWNNWGFYQWSDVFYKKTKKNIKKELKIL